VLTLVSAADGAAALDRHDEARWQAALADRILITKSDLAPGAVDDLRARLAALNPVAMIGDARAAAPDPALFDAAPGVRPAPQGHHHHHAADARIRSLVLEAGTVDASRLAAFVAMLQERHGAALLRLKGIAALRHDPERPAVVQAVGHLLHPASRLDRWPDGERRTRLVVILDGTDPAEVLALWDGFFGAPAVDRPDAAALMGEGGAGLFG
jgi:G3E family GTPase